MKNNKKLNKRFNKKVFCEVLIIIVGLLIVCLSLLADLSIFDIPESISLRVSNVEDLFFNLFTVQASIATLSIAIISIITGVINDSFLGISISEYITNIKPRLFKHNILIIFNLLITGFNYFCISFTLFNISIALFIISIFVTILLIRGVYFIFLGKNKVKEEIQNYILDNYNQYILNDLNNELSNVIEAGQSTSTNECLMIIEKIFEREILQNDYKCTEIIMQLSYIVSDSFQKIINQDNSKKINDYILFVCNLYKLANQNETKVLELEIWDYIAIDYYRALKELTYEQLSKNFVHYILHNELYTNHKNKTKEQIENSYLKNYFANVYNSLFNANRKLSETEKNKLKKDLYEEVRDKVVYSDFENEQFKMLLIHEWCNLNRIMIDSGDTLLLKKYFFEHHENGYNKTEYDLVYLITLIYLYYLAFRENTSGVEEIKGNAKRIIDDNKESLECFYYDIDIITLTQNYYDFVYNVLMSWEHINEGVVKSIIINIVLEDFIIFTCVSQFWSKHDIKIILKNVINGSVFSIYYRYFEKSHIEHFENHYAVFNEMISECNDEEEIQEKKNLLKDTLDELYREEKIKESADNAITSEQIVAFSQKVKEETESLIDKLIKPFDFKDEKEFYNCKMENTLISVSIVPYFQFKNSKIEQYITKGIFSDIVTCFLNRIFERIECHKVSYEDKNKQQKLINITNKLHINPNVTIANRDNFWNEEDKTLLKRFTSNMMRIEYPYGFNYYLILDSNLIDFSIENLHIECEDLQWDEIKSLCREDEDGQLYFNVANDFYIPFDKSEIEDYTSKTKKKISIYADIKYRLRKEKVGAGIEITFDKKAKKN